MQDNLPVFGRVVISKQGRDKGRAFLITGIADEATVYVADGEVHKLAKPKKKNLKHVKIESAYAEAIGEKLKNGVKVFDAEIRRGIMLLGYNTDEEQEG